MGRIICIILARGGSKAVPRKNLRQIGRVSLINRSVTAAVECDDIDTVFVSTDDDLIKHSATQAGAIILDRPTELSGDHVTSEAVLDHVLGKQIKGSPDICVFMQCTSPFTESSDLSLLINKLTEEKLDSAAFYMNEHACFFDIDDLCIARQPRQSKSSSGQKQRELGNAWAFWVKGYLKHHTRLHGRIGKVELKFPKNIEIDTEIDLAYARWINHNVLEPS